MLCKLSNVFFRYVYKRVHVSYKPLRVPLFLISTFFKGEVGMRTYGNGSEWMPILNFGIEALKNRPCILK